MQIKINTFLILFIFIIAFPANAYIGPGLGVGAIGAIFGFIVSIFIALFAILWYPIKRIVKRKRKEKN
jgi:membrane associated rhomboid family serine protease